MENAIWKGLLGPKAKRSWANDVWVLVDGFMFRVFGAGYIFKLLYAKLVFYKGVA